MSKHGNILLIVSAVFMIGVSLLLSKDNKRYTVDINKKDSTSFEKQHVVTFLSWDGKPKFKFVVAHNDCLEEIPEGEWDNGIFNYWYRVDTGERLRVDTPILEDCTYCGDWIHIDWLIENAVVIDDLNIDDLDVNSLREIANYIRDLND